MKKLLLSALLLIPLLFNLACVDNHVIESTRSSLVRISGDTPFGEHYVCTGFLIEPGLILTANHCLGTNLLADGDKTIVKGKDEFYDLALLTSKTSKPSLTFRDEPVMEQENLFGVGYGNGWSVPIAIREVVVVPNYAPFPGASSGIIGKAGFIGGMSGGPVIDASGKVVGIVQRGQSGLDYGVGVTMIRAFLLDNGVTLITSNGGIDWQN